MHGTAEAYMSLEALYVNRQIVCRSTPSFSMR